MTEKKKNGWTTREYRIESVTRMPGGALRVQWAHSWVEWETSYLTRAEAKKLVTSWNHLKFEGNHISILDTMIMGVIPPGRAAAQNGTVVAKAIKAIVGVQRDPEGNVVSMKVAYFDTVAPEEDLKRELENVAAYKTLLAHEAAQAAADEAAQAAADEAAQAAAASKTVPAIVVRGHACAAPKDGGPPVVATRKKAKRVPRASTRSAVRRPSRLLNIPANSGRR